MSGSFFIVGACWGNTGLVKGGGLWVSKLYLTPRDIMHLRCPMLLRDLGNVVRSKPHPAYGQAGRAGDPEEGVG